MFKVSIDVYFAPLTLQFWLNQFVIESLQLIVLYVYILKRYSMKLIFKTRQLGCRGTDTMAPKFVF